MNASPDQLPSDVFAVRLRAHREHLNVSQAELARRMSQILGVTVHPSMLTRIEQQTRTPRLDEAVALAQGLGIPIAVLLSEDPIEQRDAQLQQLRLELASAQRAWDNQRQDVERLMMAIQIMTGSTATDDPKSDADRD